MTSTAPPTSTTPATTGPVDAPTEPTLPDYNKAGIDFHRSMPRPKVRGPVIDWHTHLLASRHAPGWFAAADHFGIDTFVTMTPLEEAVSLQRNWPGRVHFIAIPRWQETGCFWCDEWLRRLESFYNIGSRVVKFHMAPGTMSTRKWRLDAPEMKRLMDEAVARGMILMTHVGDPETWYTSRYADSAKYGTRDEHYRMWESVLVEYRDHPWVGAHLGGNPEDLHRLQALLDAYPNLYLDCSATRWMVREISARRDQARDFFIRNSDRILFGTDQVSGDDRGFDFLASRLWSHRKLWETAYTGPSPIFDPDLPEDRQPRIRGLALPDEVLQKLYHDNAVKLMRRVGVDL
jgi:predicted TIM-barrel fold metal-dependent hydrolase